MSITNKLRYIRFTIWNITLNKALYYDVTKAAKHYERGEYHDALEILKGIRGVWAASQREHNPDEHKQVMGWLCDVIEDCEESMGFIVHEMGWRQCR